MRALTDVPRLQAFMKRLADAATQPADVFFTGGATAVLLGWRESTLDADIRVVPDADWLYHALPALKEELQINVELASPPDFIPELPRWRERSPFIAQEGRLTFRHYDLCAQALAKIERGHALDRRDVAEMLQRGLVDRARLRELFEAIEPQLARYPALDPPTFRRAVWAATE